MQIRQEEADGEEDGQRSEDARHLRPGAKLSVQAGSGEGTEARDETREERAGTWTNGQVSKASDDEQRGTRRTRRCWQRLREDEEEGSVSVG